MAFDHVTLKTPDGRPLVTDLTFDLPEGQRLLISGQNGAGKTALFHAIDDMWPDGTGRIIRPPHAEVMFLSQTPYMAPGKIRDQLCEGAVCKPRTDDEIKKVLRELRIEKIVVRQGGLDTEKDWMTVLSPGEIAALVIRPAGARGAGVRVPGRRRQRAGRILGAHALPRVVEDADGVREHRRARGIADVPRLRIDPGRPRRLGGARVPGGGGGVSLGEPGASATGGFAFSKSTGR